MYTSGVFGWFNADALWLVFCAVVFFLVLLAL